MKQKQIEDWMMEPYKYYSICDGIKWWETEMLPVIRKYLQILNQHNESGWKRILSMNKSHPHIKTLRAMQGRVREKFWDRPRWQSEKGMVLRKGY